MSIPSIDVLVQHVLRESMSRMIARQVMATRVAPKNETDKKPAEDDTAKTGDSNPNPSDYTLDTPTHTWALGTGLGQAIEGMLHAFKECVDKHPDATWDSKSLIERAALVAEEAGELVQAANNDKPISALMEAYQTAAVAIRFIIQTHTDLKS